MRKNVLLLVLSLLSFTTVHAQGDNVVVSTTSGQVSGNSLPVTWQPYTKENGELLEFGGSAVRIRHNHDRRLEDIINRHCFKQLDAWFASSRK